MDDPALEQDLLEGAWRGLTRVARFSRTVAQMSRPVLAELRQSVGAHRRPLRLLDMGAGGGDIGIGIARIARRHRLPVELHAADRNPRALDRTRKAAREAGVPVTTHQHDAARDPIPGEPDVVTSGLFLHHLDDDAIAHCLRALAQSTARCAVMNDLRRCRAGLIAAAVAVRIFSRSPVVRADGPQSVRAALTPTELEAAAARAGLRGAVVRRCPPFRMQMEWRRR